MKNGKARIEPGEAFVKLPRHVLESAGWRGLSINARRFIDFLMLEHLRHGGKDNGRLKAPYRQLEAFGISPVLVASAIREAEAAGFVRCQRGGMRVTSLYELAWLPSGQQLARALDTNTDHPAPDKNI